MFCQPVYPGSAKMARLFLHSKSTLIARKVQFTPLIGGLPPPRLDIHEPDAVWSRAHASVRSFVASLSAYPIPDDPVSERAGPIGLDQIEGTEIEIVDAATEVGVIAHDG
jgi:hypothetical protein